MHCMTKYVKVTWLNGGELDPPPPESSKYPEVRYSDIHEDDQIDDDQFATGSLRRQRSRRRDILMKTMTCRQPGGLCDRPDRGEMADDVINASRTGICARP